MRDRWMLHHWLASGILLTFVLAATFAPYIAPYEPRLSTGRPLMTPSPDHLLGTNDLGQDLLSQLMHGARPALIVAGVVTGVSTVLSWLVGLVAGYFRRAEAALMAITDLLLALPNIPLYLLILSLLGATLAHVILVLSLLSWPVFARVVRGAVLEARNAPYVEASRAIGASELFILSRHVFPATLGVLPAKTMLTVRFAVFAEATLAFLGLDSAGTLSWGMMLNHAFADPLLFQRAVWPWLVLPPTLAIALLILATIWLAEGTIEVTSRPLRMPRLEDSLSRSGVT